MKWAEIEGTHINTNVIQTFYWKDGKLTIWFIGDQLPIEYDDPDQVLYVKLCRSQGIRPAEEENHG